jgi:Icc-related predicted phosphoesterase
MANSTACFFLLVQAKAVGSEFLWQRLLHLQPQMHVFGHSHFAWDMDVQGE